MRFHKQKYRHRPEKGQIGDCWRTCIACLLGLERDDVPHFYEDCWDVDYVGLNKTKEWLETHFGLTIMTFPMLADSVDCVTNAMASWNPNLRYMLTGTSPRGTCHVVIASNGRILHDPALDGGGLIGPHSDKLFWIDMLVPAGVHRGTL